MADEYYPVVRQTQIKPGCRMLFHYAGRSWIMFQIEDEYFAVQNMCTHEEMPLYEGELNGYELICPLHGARFNLRDGKALTLPAVENLKCLKVRINGGVVEVSDR